MWMKKAELGAPVLNQVVVQHSYYSSSLFCPQTEQTRVPERKPGSQGQHDAAAAGAGAASDLTYSCPWMHAILWMNSSSIVFCPGLGEGRDTETVLVIVMMQML
eukprot:TRINITY_DN1279_c0_g1_i4.p2 TRINITY_DN1279_c0_g1~~TRINITY_DN1279_c0_g1_i4.p2  ORF type:complete len:104 (-),score=23.46 TRINITY_DN1279_c0_g1_i4:66-377(-)